MDIVKIRQWYFTVWLKYERLYINSFSLFKHPIYPRRRPKYLSQFIEVSEVEFEAVGKQMKINLVALAPIGVNHLQAHVLLVMTFTILPNTKQCLKILKQYLPIPNNTKQYLTNLVSVGITWHRQNIKYCCQYDSSIVRVSLWYSSDGFCLSGIVTVPILAIFAKPLILTCQSSKHITVVTDDSRAISKWWSKLRRHLWA
jgi:hypothetical protein